MTEYKNYLALPLCSRFTTTGEGTMLEVKVKLTNNTRTWERAQGRVSDGLVMARL